MRWRALIFVLLAGLQFACAGGQGQVTFKTLRHPVSMSPFLRPGQPPTSGEVLGKFNHSARAWSVLYQLIDINTEIDVSDALNEEIEKRGGSGIINLVVEVSSCAMSYVWPFIWLPVWPSCAVIDVSGDVVR